MVPRNSPLIEPTDYSNAWRDLALRWCANVAVFVGFVPFVAIAHFVVAWALPAANSAKQDLVVMVAAFVWGAVFIATGIRLSVFRCPRCKELFFIRAGHGWHIFRRSCIHCGLRIGQRDHS